VALGTGDAPKAPVKIAACGEVLHGARAIEPVERAEQRQRGHGAVEEARVGLAERVAGKDARGLLQAQNDCFAPDEKVEKSSGGRVQSITRGASMRESASCVARTWMALSVDRMCASCPGCAPKAPWTIVGLATRPRADGQRVGDVAYLPRHPSSSSHTLLSLPHLAHPCASLYKAR
jgi:hypothetical protein